PPPAPRWRDPARRLAARLATGPPRGRRGRPGALAGHRLARPRGDLPVLRRVGPLRRGGRPPGRRRAVLPLPAQPLRELRLGGVPRAVQPAGGATWRWAGGLVRRRRRRGERRANPRPPGAR